MFAQEFREHNSWGRRQSYRVELMSTFKKLHVVSHPIVKTRTTLATFFMAKHRIEDRKRRDKRKTIKISRYGWGCLISQSSFHHRVRSEQCLLGRGVVSTCAEIFNAGQGTGSSWVFNPLSHCNQLFPITSKLLKYTESQLLRHRII